MLVKAVPNLFPFLKQSFAFVTVMRLFSHGQSLDLKSSLLQLNVPILNHQFLQYESIAAGSTRCRAFKTHDSLFYPPPPHGTLRVLLCIKMKLSISFSANSCHKFITEGNESKLCASIRSTWSQKLLLMLWVKSWGEGARPYESEVRTTNEIFPWNKMSWPMSECTCCWVRDILVIDQGELERERASLFGDTVYGCLSVFIT